MILSSSTNPAANRPPGCLHVILVTPWYGGNLGGVAIVAESLIHALRDKNIRCTVLEILGDGWRPKFRRGQSGEEIITLCVRDYSLAEGKLAQLAARYRGWIAQRIIRRMGRSQGQCVAHFHYSMPEYEQISEYFREANVPTVVTFHGSDLIVNMDDPRIFDATQTVVASAHMVTAVSQALLETLLSIFPTLRDRSAVIYNSVPPQFAERVRQLDQLNNGDEESEMRDIDVLFVGNLIERKGVDVLLRAWQQVQAIAPDLRLAIAGDGESAPALHELAAELDLNRSVTFLGRQPRAALPGLYRRAKLLAVPSRAEPLGVVVLEAQLCGAVVIASDVGGLPEMIDDGITGLLVPPEDAQALADAIICVLTQDGARETLARAARARVLVEFTPENIATQYVQLYTDARAGSPT